MLLWLIFDYVQSLLFGLMSGLSIATADVFAVGYLMLLG